MKNFLFFFLLNTAVVFSLYGQIKVPVTNQREAITSLIDQYSEAREKRDTTLLKAILTTDIDQLVSTGEWRTGIDIAVQGMQRSSANTPGTRTLQVDKIRMLNPATAIVDCKYEIQNASSTTLRRMWSTFIVVKQKKVWKIGAIRNMLPAGE